MSAKSPNTHTPGPWTLSRNLGIASANGREILFPGHVSRGVEHAEREANARLIASAPELLEALRMLRSFIGIVHDEVIDLTTKDFDEMYELASAAIAKAEGTVEHA